ncbi:MAG: UvrD-helicase domain-containing protein [Anaerolineales bacterium]|nr:UvrD-helicase domain-containing protein [Anaerolineales bacterium]
MTWQTVQKSAYLSDFVELNKNLQQAVVKAIQEMEQDPVTVRGNTIKKLKGYTNVWRYRLGDFRLIYAVAPQAQLIQLLAIGPRGQVYERFNYQGWDTPEAAVEFGPELAKETDWEAKQQAWSRPQPAEPDKERLPRKLSPALLSKWRIDPQYHPVLMRCLFDEDLINATELIPPEVVGRVMDGLYPAPVERLAAQADQVLLDPEDLLRYADGSLHSFLLNLDERQKPLVDWALQGPTLIKGGPGSGKSTVALYRIRAIYEAAQARQEPMPEILFCTYTNSLTSVSESLLQQLLRETLGLKPGEALPKSLRVTTLHATARWIVSSSGRKADMAAAGQRQAARSAARQASDLLESVANLRDEYLLEEFEWVIEGQDCNELADYLAASRAGRGIPLNQSARTAVWELYVDVQARLATQQRVSWTGLARQARDLVRQGEFGRRWDYVIVDEAQDLKPIELALCVELCRTPAGVYLTADANQSLYNRGFRWGQVHEDLQVTGRTRILRRNYRSTREIAEAAADLLRGQADFDEEALTQEYINSGMYPILYAAQGSQDQAEWIGQQIYQAARELRLPLNAAVILVPSSSVGLPLAKALTAQGLNAKFMNSRQFDLADPCLKVTTLHAAKGLEFPIVVIAHVETGRLPRETAATEPQELEAYLDGQRKLFYVGCTRAMRYLFVSFDQQLASPFIGDLSSDRWLMAES